MKYKFLTDDFIKQYDGKRPPFNALGEFVYYRTYSRWLQNEQRRETWLETCRRAIEYNMNLAHQHLVKIGYKPDVRKMRRESQSLFDNMFNLRQFLSGRTLWIGGGENDVADKYPLANFNCSFLNISKWDDLGDLFYMLLVGTGVGFKCTKDMASHLSPIRNNVTLLSSSYNPLPRHQRIEHSKLTILENGYAKVYVGDSKEGWVEALRLYIKILTEESYKSIHTVKINYNSVRPKGERLRTFGGTASGHEPLQEMFEGIDKVLKNRIDPTLDPIKTNTDGYGRVRPIHILDIGNLIGANVVVGGVRRTSEIFLMDSDDWECVLAKYDINGIWGEESFKEHDEIRRLLVDLGVSIPTWFDEVGERHYSDDDVDKKFPFNEGRKLHHRRMSNNSVAFTKKPSREWLHLLFKMMQSTGEPGCINLEEARRRRPNAEGLNPCAEILLDSYGVCNLTTLNITAFVRQHDDSSYHLDVDSLLQAQRMSARAGLRMTLVELEISHWNVVQQRDRLLGPSLTGFYDAMGMLGYDETQERDLLKLLHETARDEVDKYAYELRVSSPLLVTTVKPEGTLSQVAGGVSSGLHRSHSPYYIRRIRINATDPLAKVVQSLGWTVNPEVGTPGNTCGERIENARTLVIDFPIASGAIETKDDIDVARQFDTYFRFQKYYTEHNSSNTITVRPHEWAQAEQIVWDKWNEFTAVSFLALDGGSYELAPYEAITRERYAEMKSSMKPFDPALLQKFEQVEVDFDIGNDGCDDGICPVR